MTPLLDDLTPREETALESVANGMTQRETAHRMGIGERTVRAHLEEARRKLGASSTTHAVKILTEARALAR